MGRLRAAGHWRSGDPPIMVALDSGYDVTRLAFVLADLPVHLVGRIRADPVLLAATPPRPVDEPGPMGRPRRHGAVMVLADPDSWPAPTAQMHTATARYGKAEATAWDRMHPRLAVEHLPGQREAKPIWLWSSAPADTEDEVTRCWQAYLRRFDLEHTFRPWKQTLGWTAPKIHSPQAADRWTWLVIAAHTQLRLARHLAVDLRRLWEKPLPLERLTPARVRRGSATSARRSASRPAHRTQPSRAWAPTRREEPSPRHPLRRRHDRHPSRRRHDRAADQRLNAKLNRGRSRRTQAGGAAR